MHNINQKNGSQDLLLKIFIFKIFSFYASKNPENSVSSTTAFNIDNKQQISILL